MIKKSILFMLLILMCFISLQNFIYANPNQEFFEGTFSGSDLDLEEEIKNISMTNVKPVITFFVHGLSGNASHWSNTLGDNFGITGNSENENFSYNPNSIIEILRRRTQGEIYEVESIEFTDEFHLYALEIQNDLYKRTIKTELTNISSHSIVVYNAPEHLNDETHQFLYEHFKKVINRISYDVRESLNLDEIRINLIGHSRGGLINMLYATDFPYNVDGLFSIGTPYNGTELGPLASLIFGFSDTGSGYNQIINTNEQNNYVKTKWINMQNSYFDLNIDFHAIGVSSGISYLFNILLDIYNDPIYEDNKSQVLIIIKLLRIFEKTFYKREGLFDVENLDREDLETYSHLFPVLVAVMLDLYAPELTQEQKDAIAKIFFNLYYSFEVNELILRNDMMVDKDSQLAVGFDDVEEENKVPINNYEKIYTWKNTNINNRASIEPGIAHNLQTRDLDIINYILQNLNFAGHDSYLNTIYLSNNKLGALSKPISSQNVSITFPSSIYGISKYFSDYVSLNVTNIDIAKNIELIETGAFKGFDHIKSFYVEQGNAHFRADGYGVLYSYNKKELIKFVNGKNISSYATYSETEEISEYAFTNNSYLMQLNLNNVSIIKEKAFYKANQLQNINGNNVERVIELALHGTEWYTNSNNNVLGNVLVKYIGNETIVNLNNYSGIYSYAFFNKNNIERIIIDSGSLNSELYLSKFAFVNLPELKYFFLMDDKAQTVSELSILNTNSNLKIFYLENKLKGRGHLIRNDFNDVETQIQILLHSNGGIVNDFSYIQDMKKELIILPEPTKSGVVFSGWFENINFTGLKITQGYVWKLHDTDFYAEYIPPITYEKYSETQHKVINHINNTTVYRPHLADMGNGNPRWVNCILCDELIDLWKTPVFGI